MCVYVCVSVCVSRVFESVRVWKHTYLSAAFTTACAEPVWCGVMCCGVRACLCLCNVDRQ